MSKIAIVIFSDTDTKEALGKVSNAFVLASEAIEAGDELKIIFEGSGTKWIGEMEKEDHPLHQMYIGIKSHITGACEYCATAFGVKNQIKKSGVKLINEFKQHPSLRSLVVNDFHVFNF